VDSSMKPYYRDERAGIVIYNGDCREMLPGLSAASVDLVLTDPPYGINLRTEWAGSGNKHGFGSRHEKIVGDDAPFDPSHLLRFQRLILWGGNCYANRLPASPVWLAWDKVTKNGLKVRIAEMELAWTNLAGKPRVFRHLWSGNYRASEQGTAYHPAQKPVALMSWCICVAKLERTTPTILDPYCGSGSVLCAAKDAGCRAIGIEINERYCEIAARRLEQGVLFGVGAGE